MGRTRMAFVTDLLGLQPLKLLLDDQVLDTPIGGSHTAASVIAYCGIAVRPMMDQH